MGSSRTSRRTRAGYTLIELMMVVMIIAISVVAFAPGFGRAMANRRVSTAARELIRIGRRARSDTFGYLRSHLIWIQPSQGRVQLLRGTTPSCTAPPWAAIQADCAANANAMSAQRCLENVDFGEWSPSDDISLREEQLGTGGVGYSDVSRAICFAPSGQVFLASNNALGTAAGALSDVNTVFGGVVFTLHLGVGDPVAGTDLIHRVLFPLGSTPRALR